MGIGATVLFILTAFSWLLMMVCLNGFAGVDARGDQAMGVALSFFAALVFTCLTWLWLGFLLLTVSSQGIAPAWVGITAMILVPASGAAALAALYLVGGPHPRWPAATLAAVPVLIAAFALALYRPALRPLASGGAGTAIWGVIMILTIAPWPALAARLRQKQEAKEERRQAQQAWDKQERERKRAESLAKIKVMPADAPIPSWYELLDPENGAREEALEALRHVERRQSDIQEMLHYGIGVSMSLAPLLDLKPTPGLCEAARAYLTKHAKGSRRRPQNEPIPFELDKYEAASLDGIRWFASRGCDCRQQIEELQAAAQTQLDSPDRRKFLAALDEIRRL
jgi:hypothetical protein